jgi:hypothetical protein
VVASVHVFNVRFLVRLIAHPIWDITTFPLLSFYRFFSRFSQPEFPDSRQRLNRRGFQFPRKLR